MATPHDSGMLKDRLWATALYMQYMGSNEQQHMKHIYISELRILKIYYKSYLGANHEHIIASIVMRNCTNGS